MSNSIGPFTPLTPLTPLGKAGMEKGLVQDGQEFSSFLKDALNKLDQTQVEAEQATVALVTGQIDDFHTPVIAMQKASLAMGLAVTVRNKVLEAYHEIMRMQI